MALLTISEILRWDPLALDDVFKIAQKRSGTFETFGSSIQQVHSRLSDWKGDTAEALHDVVGKVRTDIDADGQESTAVAKALQTAESEIVSVKRALREQLDEAKENHIDVADSGTCSIAQGHPITAESMEKLLSVQQQISNTMVRAMTVDDDIAYAIRLAVMEVPKVSSALYTGNSDEGSTMTGSAARAIALAQSIGDGRSYVYGGTGPGYDCSGAQSAVYAAITGKSQGTRYFTTESDFLALGFKKGYMPGAYNIGVHRGGGGPNSHMAGTLPNGVNFESGGAHDSTLYGGSAAGALNPEFELHYYLPVAGVKTAAVNTTVPTSTNTAQSA